MSGKHHGRHISVIGLGYVGLPVAVAFGTQARVTGFDINESRIAALRRGEDLTGEVDPEDLRAADVHFSADPADLAAADFHIIAVPTPINTARQPDLSALLGASALLGRHLKRGDIVVYESTVYPGATEEECIPVLERESGLQAGLDFQVGYSPERINPGDREHSFTKIRKVVSAQTPESLAVVAAVYGSVVTAGIHEAPTIRVAEAAKVIENTQRDLNISLMNELAVIFQRLGIDTGDVLAAAGTKWNFLPFRPGLVGGHCIGVDPYYLTYRAQIAGYQPQVILAGRRINDEMGRYVADRVIHALIARGGVVRDATVTILGFTFKEDVPDTRNTRVIDIVHALGDYGVEVQVHDPVADAEGTRHEYTLELSAREHLKPARAVILAVPHRSFREQGWKLVETCLGETGGVVYDVHRILERDKVPANIELIRL